MGGISIHLAFERMKLLQGLIAFPSFVREVQGALLLGYTLLQGDSSQQLPEPQPDVAYLDGRTAAMGTDNCQNQELDTSDTVCLKGRMSGKKDL